MSYEYKFDLNTTPRFLPASVTIGDYYINTNGKMVEAKTKAPFYLDCNGKGLYRFTVIHRQTGGHIFSCDDYESAVHHLRVVIQDWIENA